MMQLNDTVLRNKGQHLTLSERIEIQSMNRQGFTNRHIARCLGRSHSTINNEIKRGTTQQVRLVNQKKYYTQSYFAETGQAIYTKNREASRKPYKLYQVEKFLEFATHKIKEERWSPDAVVGYAQVNGLFEKHERVCTKSLYRYIDEGLMELMNMDLLLKLRRNTRKKRIRAHKRVLGTSIDQRPELVNERREFGHWEVDTVIGSKRREEPVLLTLVERITRYTLILKIEGKTEAAVQGAMSQLACLPNASQLFKTMTADNGSEFAGLAACMKGISEVYFAHPYSSWERGTNEKHNGILRRFIPKGTLLSCITTSNIRRINQWMNNLPRKIHNYLTPSDLFNQYISELITT